MRALRSQTRHTVLHDSGSSGSIHALLPQVDVSVAYPGAGDVRSHAMQSRRWIAPTSAIQIGRRSSALMGGSASSPSWLLHRPVTAFCLEPSTKRGGWSRPPWSSVQIDRLRCGRPHAPATVAGCSPQATQTERQQRSTTDAQAMAVARRRNQIIRRSIAPPTFVPALSFAEYKSGFFHPRPEAFGYRAVQQFKGRPWITTNPSKSSTPRLRQATGRMLLSRHKATRECITNVSGAICLKAPGTRCLALSWTRLGFCDVLPRGGAS